MSSRAAGVLDVLVTEFAVSVVRFPIWWYSNGFRRVATSALNALRYRSEEFAFALWLKNLFVPMYGQVDITGKIISVFMRIVVIIGRGIAFCIEALLYFVGLMCWLLAPFMIALFLGINIAVWSGRLSL
jgi:hypothetical protein